MTQEFEIVDKFPSIYQQTWNQFRSKLTTRLGHRCLGLHISRSHLGTHPTESHSGLSSVFRVPFLAFCNELADKEDIWNFLFLPSFFKSVNKISRYNLLFFTSTMIKHHDFLSMNGSTNLRGKCYCYFNYLYIDSKSSFVQMNKRHGTI